MRFENYTYLWPARPEKAIPPDFISLYERRGWVAQYKKNGTCNVQFVSPEKEITAMTRHNTSHKLWHPTTASNAPFKALPGKGWYVIETEVLHSKYPGIKDTHYIFDILVADGAYLIHMTFAERMELLQSLFLKGNEVEEYSHYVVSDNVHLAKTITGNLKQKWADANKVAAELDGAPLDEGLVFKNPMAKLNIPNRQHANNNWMVKCRVGHKNYSF